MGSLGGETVLIPNEMNLGYVKAPNQFPIFWNIIYPLLQSCLGLVCHKSKIEIPAVEVHAIDSYAVSQINPHSE